MSVSVASLVNDQSQIRYAHIVLVVVFYVEYAVLKSIYEDAWPWDSTSPAPTQWCEQNAEGDFAREPVNAFWSFSLCGAALFLSYCSCHDIWLSSEGRKPKNMITGSPLVSLSFSVLAIFLFLMTITSHCCSCWHGEIWANAATDAAAAWPGVYIFWLWHNQRARISGAGAIKLPPWTLLAAAVLMVISFYLYEYMFAWIGLGAFYIAPAAGLTAYANYHWMQTTKEEHDPRVLRFAAVAFVLGYLCRLIDSWHLLCSPTSYFQWVSLWHVLFSVAICLQYLHLRAHHYRSVAASFRAPEGILGEPTDTTGPRNKFT